MEAELNYFDDEEEEQNEEELEKDFYTRRDDESNESYWKRTWGKAHLYDGKRKEVEGKVYSLLEHGASVFACDSSGNYPWEILLQRRFLDHIDEFLVKGVPVSEVTEIVEREYQPAEATYFAYTTFEKLAVRAKNNLNSLLGTILTNEDEKRQMAKAIPTTIAAVKDLADEYISSVGNITSLQRDYDDVQEQYNDGLPFYDPAYDESSARCGIYHEDYYLSDMAEVNRLCWGTKREVREETREVTKLYKRFLSSKKVSSHNDGTPNGINGLVRE